jgi:hypothetical protein
MKVKMMVLLGHAATDWPPELCYCAHYCQVAWGLLLKLHCCLVCPAC